jgi:hypothetical protein
MRRRDHEEERYSTARIGRAIRATARDLGGTNVAILLRKQLE